MSKFFKEQGLKNSKSINTGEKIKNFQVPLKIFKEYCSLVKSRSKALIEKFLYAIGLDVYTSTCNVNWEQFIFLNCLLKFFTATKEEYIKFFVSVFNPYDMKFI